MTTVTWQQVSIGLAVLTLLVVRGAFYVSIRSYKKTKTAAAREAIRDVGERGLDRHLKLEPQIHAYDSNQFAMSTTTIIFQFAVAASTGARANSLRPDQGRYVSMDPNPEPQLRGHRKVETPAHRHFGCYRNGFIRDVWPYQ